MCLLPCLYYHDGLYLQNERLSNRPLWYCFCQLFILSQQWENWYATSSGSLMLSSIYHHGWVAARQMNDPTRDGSLPSVSSKADDLTLADSYLMSPVKERKLNSSEVERAWEESRRFLNTRWTTRSQWIKGFHGLDPQTIYRWNLECLKVLILVMKMWYVCSETFMFVTGEKSNIVSRYLSLPWEYSLSWLGRNGSRSLR